LQIDIYRYMERLVENDELAQVAIFIR